MALGERADRTVPLVLAGGCNGSGLTLLSLMLDAHPMILCGPDVNLLCHPVIWHPGSPNAVDRLQAVLAGGDESMGVLPWCPIESAKLAWYLTSMAELRGGLTEFEGPLSALRFVHEARRVVERKSLAIDFSAGNLWVLAQALDAEPSLRAVLLIRDGRSVLQSRLRARMTVKAAAMQWVAGAAVAHGLLQRWGAERVHLIAFEALVQDPLPVLEALCGFLGVAGEAERMAARRSLRVSTDASVATGQSRMSRWGAHPCGPLVPAMAASGRSGVTLRHLQQLAATKVRREWLTRQGLSDEFCDGAGLMRLWGYAMDGKEVASPALSVKEQDFGRTPLERFLGSLEPTAEGDDPCS